MHPVQGSGVVISSAVWVSPTAMVFIFSGPKYFSSLRAGLKSCVMTLCEWQAAYSDFIPPVIAILLSGVVSSESPPDSV